MSHELPDSMPVASGGNISNENINDTVLDETVQIVNSPELEDILDKATEWDKRKGINRLDFSVTPVEQQYSARLVWNVNRLTELPPSTINPDRKIFRFSIETVIGLFNPDGSPIPGQKFYRWLTYGCRGMLDKNGRIMFVLPARNVGPHRQQSLGAVCINTAREIIKIFYTTKLQVKLKNGKKQDLWEYLGVDKPGVMESLTAEPRKRKPLSEKKRYQIKPVIKRYPKFRPAHIKRKKADKSVLSLDMLPPDSLRAKNRARGLANWEKRKAKIEEEKLKNLSETSNTDADGNSTT
jgi:hypothetical protein